MNLDEQLTRYATTAELVSEAKLNTTIKAAQQAFWQGEAEQGLSWQAFLYQQSHYIKKRWWVLQGGVLLFLWLLLRLAESDGDARRCMGILAPLFVILILPELWKNDTSRSLEVEAAARFSLRRITAARLVLFGGVDLTLLTLFLAVSTVSLGLSITELTVQFLLPMLVTCCICFRMFCRPRGGMVLSLTLCLFWLSLWTLVVLREDVYSAVSLPVWAALVALAVVYLGWCVARTWYSEAYQFQFE